jgi:hypothetical protein
MSDSDKAPKRLARLRHRLKSMPPGSKLHLGAPVDCKLMLSIDEVYLKQMAESLGRENMSAAMDAFARDLNESAGTVRAQLGAGDASGAKRSAQRLKGLFALWSADLPEKPMSPAQVIPSTAYCFRTPFASSACIGMSGNISSSTRVRSFVRIGFETK